MNPVSLKTVLKMVVVADDVRQLGLLYQVFAHPAHVAGGKRTEEIIEKACQCCCTNVTSFNLTDGCCKDRNFFWNSKLFADFFTHYSISVNLS